MVLKPEQQEMQHKMRKLLTEAITTLCQEGLNYRSHFNVEGLLGITLDDEDVFLVTIKETVTDQDVEESSGDLTKQAFTEAAKSSVNEASAERPRKRKRKRSNDSIERLQATNVGLNNNNVEKKDSNVAIEIRPVGLWAEGGNEDKKPYDKEDAFDDNASSPGELIVVREDNLSDNEREFPFTQGKQGHSTGATFTAGAQEEPDRGKSIYASSNGQTIATPATDSFQPHPAAWGGGFPRTTQDEPGRSFGQQVCCNFAPFLFKL